MWKEGINSDNASSSLRLKRAAYGCLMNGVAVPGLAKTGSLGLPEKFASKCRSSHATGHTVGTDVTRPTAVQVGLHSLMCLDFVESMWTKMAEHDYLLRVEVEVTNTRSSSAHVALRTSEPRERARIAVRCGSCGVHAPPTTAPKGHALGHPRWRLGSDCLPHALVGLAPIATQGAASLYYSILNRLCNRTDICVVLC
eukprot:SAG11_NODE_4198_length_2019_cov_8.222917_2_plen_198_part_00